MQRLLQSEERNPSSVDAESSDRKPSFELPYQFGRDKEPESQSLFLKSFNNNINQHLINNNMKESFLKFDRTDLCKPFFDCEDRKTKIHAFQEYKQPETNVDVDECSNGTVDKIKYEKSYQEEYARRLSCDSEDSVDVSNVIVEDRVSSEEDYNTSKDEDVRSPVDLTSRRLLETNTYDRQSSGSITEDSTMDESCKHERVPDSGSRRLAFSVENILDPNKFTGKQFEDSLKEKLTTPYSWKPHLDYMDTSPTTVSRTGRLTQYTYR